MMTATEAARRIYARRDLGGYFGELVFGSDGETAALTNDTISLAGPLYQVLGAMVDAKIPVPTGPRVRLHKGAWHADGNQAHPLITSAMEAAHGHAARRLRSMPDAVVSPHLAARFNPEFLPALDDSASVTMVPKDCVGAGMAWFTLGDSGVQYGVLPLLDDGQLIDDARAIIAAVDARPRMATATGGTEGGEAHA